MGVAGAGGAGAAGTGAAGAGAAGKPGTGAAGTGAAGKPGVLDGGIILPVDGGILPVSDAGDVCASLQKQYAEALAAAKVCNLALSRLTCQESVDTTLACPACKAWVDDRSTLDLLQKKWVTAGCDQVRRVCPAVLCINPGKPMCSPVKGSTSTTGTCSSLPVVQPL
jgi:hypothetical protein